MALKRSSFIIVTAHSSLSFSETPSDHLKSIAGRPGVPSLVRVARGSQGGSRTRAHDGCSDAARDLKARCLWVETQTTNYPAVQSYRGMELSGAGLIPLCMIQMMSVLVSSPC